jgi:hypothetical protein
MANEVIIEEYERFDERIQAPCEWITTQVLDIAELSAALNSKTRYVRVCSKGTGFWYKFGTATVSAVADTNGNAWLPANAWKDHVVGTGLYIDTAA